MTMEELFKRESSMTKLYDIVRFYREDNHPNHQMVVREKLTLEEAQKHCKDPNTRCAGVWFDGYRERN